MNQCSHCSHSKCTNVPEEFLCTRYPRVPLEVDKKVDGVPVITNGIKERVVDNYWPVMMGYEGCGEHKEGTPKEQHNITSMFAAVDAAVARKRPVINPARQSKKAAKKKPTL